MENGLALSALEPGYAGDMGAIEIYFIVLYIVQTKEQRVIKKDHHLPPY